LVASTVRLSILGVYGIITTVTEGRGVLRGMCVVQWKHLLSSIQRLPY
jgi:hypothetical protein